MTACAQNQLLKQKFFKTPLSEGVFHLDYFDNTEEGEGEGGDDEHEGEDGEEESADPRPLLTGCRQPGSILTPRTLNLIFFTLK